MATDERAMVAFDLMSVDLSQLAEAEILKSTFRAMCVCNCMSVHLSELAEAEILKSTLRAMCVSQKF